MDFFNSAVDVLHGEAVVKFGTGQSAVDEATTAKPAEAAAPASAKAQHGQNNNGPEALLFVF